MFVSHRGRDAAFYAARLRHDLLHRLRSERLAVGPEPRSGDIVLVVVAQGGGSADYAFEPETPELTARQLEEVVLRDDLVITVRVVAHDARGSAIPSVPSPTPRVWFLRWGSWEHDARRLILAVRMHLDVGLDRPAHERQRLADAGASLEMLLHAEAAGQVVRRRAPHLSWDRWSDDSLMHGDPRFEMPSETQARRREDVEEASRAYSEMREPPRRARYVWWRRPLLLSSLALASGGLIAAIVRWLGGSTIDVSIPTADEVDVTVFCPPRAAPGETLLVQVFAHLPAQARDARALSSEFDVAAEARGFTSLAIEIASGSTLGFELRAQCLDVDGSARTMRWQRRTASVQFPVIVRTGTRIGTHIAKLIVSSNSVPVGEIAFKLTVTDAEEAADAPRPQPAGENARAYEIAFISYAREDWAEVLRRVQMLRLPQVARRLRTFHDVLDMDPGERWNKRLYLEIDRCDVLLLFWSRAAHDSKWVRREVRYALDRKVSEFDPPEILPVVLEVPPCPPWPELADWHFDDAIARLIGAAAPRDEPPTEPR